MALKRSVSSQHSLPSPDGALIATLQQSSLAISSYTSEHVRTIPLPPEFIARCRFIRWSRWGGLTEEAIQKRGNNEKQSQCNRILLADDDTVRVYDINDFSWSALIERAACNLGRIADVTFGYHPNECLVFSDFGVKLTIWSLTTSRGVEIKDPKYTIPCYSFRARTGHMAILTRPAAQDILMLLSPSKHELITSVELPTVDAQEVSWSLDGCWLAIRDAASSGHKVLIYTADGQLFKTYLGFVDGTSIGLGIKRMAWNPSNGGLLLGDYSDNVTIISENTFSPLLTWHHPVTIQLSGVNIWQEQLNAAKERSYVLAPQPASPPTSVSFAKTNNPAHGISILALNTNGTLLATRNDSIPTTIWIWSLCSGIILAVLIHHSPIKRVSWHSQQHDLLLMQCAIPEPAIHLYQATWDVPRIVKLPLDRIGGRLEANWLQSPDSESYALVISSACQYVTAQVSQNADLISAVGESDREFKSAGTGAEPMFDEGNSLDLSPIKITRDETLEVNGGYYGGNELSESSFGMDNEMVNDTFHYRRHVKAAV